MVEVLGRRAFVGRGRELARLEAVLREVGPGTGGTVLVAGEAGIGKSRLLARFAESARAGGALVLEGACLESTSAGIPYAPFVEILRDLVRSTPPERLPALLGPARAELTRLVPELALRAADLPAPAAPDRSAQARLFELILGVIERLAATRPVVVEIDDLHWADGSTRELLSFLVRALRDDPVLILMALRTDDEGEAVGNLAFVAELEREEQVERIDLGRFGRDEVEAQVAALRDGPPDPGAVDRLLSRSDGNPFYVEELVLAGDGTGRELPPVLRDVLAARVASLSDAAHGVLRSAAAAGRRIDDELLAAVLDVPVRSLADALREALASGILVRVDGPGGSAIEFRHALLQEVVSDELFPGERVALHAAFAAALEARAVSGGMVEPAAVARHWDAARRPDRALEPTVRAAEAAERAFAFSEAEHLWSRAETLAAAAPAAAAALGLARDVFLEHAADAAVLSGDYGSATRLGTAALTSVDPAADPARAGHLHDRLRWYLWEAGDRAAAAVAVETALRLIPADPPSVGRARALAQHAGILLYAGEYERAVAEANEAIAVAHAVDAPGEEALALGVLGWSQAVLGDVEAGLGRFREGQAIATRIGSVEGVALAAFNLASLLDRIGQSRASLEAAAEGYATTERLGVARTYGGLLLGFRAKAEFLLGAWDAADASTSLGLRHGATDRAELWLSINRARLLVARGAFDDGRRLLERARAIEDRLGGTEFGSPLLAAEAELATWLGRLDDIRAIAGRGIELAAKPGPPDPSLAWLAATVLRAEADAAALRRTGASVDDPEAARVIARIDAATAAAAETTRELLAGSRRGRALLELLRAERARLGDHDDPDAWAAVADAFAEADRPYPAAYARYREAAAVLASRGPRARAGVALRLAHGAALGLGAAPLGQAVERLARQARIQLGDETAGREPEGSADTPAAIGLTAREREVLRLVAGGWSNQMIADALFITRKTASVHVSNIMAKLGVDDRTAAAAIAHRLGVEGADLPGEGHGPG